MKKCSRRLAIVMSVLGSMVGVVASTNAAAELSCDGPGHTPILYEKKEFRGQTLRIFLEKREGLYLSDEESFFGKASSICVQSGYRVELFDKNGVSISLEGPIELNLSTMNWDNRAHSAMATKITMKPVPNKTLDFSTYKTAVSTFKMAEESSDCDEVEKGYSDLGNLLKSREPIPQSVSNELGLGRPVVGEYARLKMYNLRQHKTQVCQSQRVTTIQDPVAQKARELERYFALGVGSSDCEVVKDMSEKLVTGLDSASTSHALKLLAKLQEEKPECFN